MQRSTLFNTRLFFFLIFLAAKLTSEELPKELWRYTTNGSVLGVAYDSANKRVFCGSSDANLYCLNESGELLWSYAGGGTIYAVAYDPKNKKVFCGSGDCTLSCLSDSGSLLWSYKTGGHVFGVACDVDNKRVFCGSSDKKLYFLNYNGVCDWSYTTGDYVVYLDYDRENKRVFCGSNDGKLYCFNHSGGFLWSYKTAAYVRGVACDSKNKRVFCGSFDKNLYCLDGNGNPLWSYKTGGSVYGVAYDPESKKVFCGSGDHNLTCLSDAGELLWSYPVASIHSYSKLDLDLEKKVIFIASAKSIAAIQYGNPVEPTPPPIPDSVPTVDIKSVLEELEKSREKKSIEIRKNLQVLLDYCPISFPQSVCTPVSRNLLYTIETAPEPESATQVLYSVDPYLNKREMKRFPPIFSPSNPLVLDKKGTLYTSLSQGDICRYMNGQKFTLFDREKCLSPTIAKNGLLYFPSKEGKLICIDPDTEGVVWEVDTQESAIWPSPAVDDEGTAYFASRDTLYAISLTGAVVLEKALYAPIDDLHYGDEEEDDPDLPSTEIRKKLTIDSPLRIGSEGNLYFLSDPSTLTCIDREGNYLWDYRIYTFTGVTSPAITLPACDREGYLYFGSSKGTIYCIDSQGKWVWQKTTKKESPIECAPTSNAQGEIFFLTQDGNLYRKRKLTWFEKPPFNWFF